MGNRKEEDVAVSRVARSPIGLLRNSLPDLWLCQRDDGSLWVMRDGSTSEVTGPQTCLIVIRADVVQAARASKTPLGVP